MNFNFKYGGSSKAGNQTHKRLKIDNFLGVDYASSKLNAANFRATEMKNYIHRDGKNHKRFGWNEIAKIKDDEGNLLSINGFWEYKDRTMEQAVYIVHAGTKLFRIESFGRNSFETKYTDISNDFAFLDQRSFGVVRGDFLYLFSGNKYLMYGKWDNEKYELREVENGEKTYIPTTTIGISAEGSNIDVRRTHEEINLLHKRRRNKLIGEMEDSDIVSYPISDYLDVVGGVYTYNIPLTKLEEMQLANVEGCKIEIRDSGSVLLKAVNIPLPSGYTMNVDLLDVDYDFDLDDYISEGSITWAKPATKVCPNCNGIGQVFIPGGNCPTCDGTGRIIENGLPILCGTCGGDGIENDYSVTCSVCQGTKYIPYIAKNVVLKLFEANATLIDTSHTLIFYLIRSLNYRLDTKNISNPKIWINGEENSITDTYINFFGREETFENCFDLTNGIVTFNTNFPPDIEGENNIIVEFDKEIQGNADKINQCQFGIMFGYSDTESLFISGKPNMPNYDFHSSYPDDTETTSGIPVEEDLTYFGDLGYATVGSIQSKIMGYTLLEDGTLAIHKEANRNEPTIYLRNAVLDNAIDLDGNVVVDRNGNPYKKVYFPKFPGSMGEGMLNRFGSANLAGDKLFLSRNGVFGIVMNQNIKSNERFARERSRLVNPILTKEDLEKASAIVFENRYYLSVNGKCYIADGRFRNQTNVEMDDTFSYEWWVWDNDNARIWFILDNNLAFGTDNGQLCVFDRENSFTDQTYETVPTGGIMFNSVDNKFIINEAYDNLILKLNDNESFVLKLEEDAEFELAEIILTKEDITSVSAGRINVSFEKFFSKIQFLIDKEVYIDDLEYANPLQVNTPYLIKNLDYDTYSFELWDSLGENKINIVGNEFTISRFIKDLSQTITNMNVEEGSFQLLDYDQSNIKNVYVYNGSVLADLSGYFSFKNNVVAEWWTPIFDLGTSEYSKNLHSIAFTPETIIGGKIDFGFKTRKSEKQYAMEGVTSLDFTDLDFTNFSFETTSFAKSFTKKLNVRNVNFIMFYFKSTNEKDSVVNNLSITYSIGRLNKGVK